MAAPPSTHADPQEATLTRYGAFTGSISAIRDLGSVIARTWRQIASLRPFDHTTNKLLVAFIGELTRLDERCRTLGYRHALSDDGGTAAGRPVPEEEVLAAMKACSIDGDQAVSIVEISIRNATRAVREVTEQFDRIGGLPAKSESGHNGLDADQSARPVAASNDPDPDLERGQDGGDGSMDPRGSSPEGMFRKLQQLHIVPPSTDSSTRLDAMARSTHDKIHEGLTRLEKENLLLQGFITSRQVGALARIVPAGFAEVQQNINKTGALVAAAMSMSMSRSGSGSGGATTDLDRALQLAGLNSLLAMGQMDWEKLAANMPDRRIEDDDLEPVGDDEDYTKVPRSLVEYDSAVCLLEWNTAINADTTAKRDQARERLFNLVCRLEFQDSRYLRILKPMGWLEDLVVGEGARYAIVYQLPDGFDAESHEVVSLRDLLTKPSRRPPSLNDRFALAIALACVLRQFQSSQWLHQDIRPGNVLFVTPRGTPAAGQVDLREPYLTGFDFSRFVGADSDERRDQFLERNFYQHPLRREKGPGAANKATYRYRGEFDIYSLGRVLLDVARWKITRDADLEAGLAGLWLTVGKPYAAAVRWCLGKPVGSPVAVPSIRQKEGLSAGAQAWSSGLIGSFDDNVLLKLVQCRN